MSALVIAARPDCGCIDIATDAAIYQDQKVVAFGQKVYAVPHWPGAVVNVGNAAATPLFGWWLAQTFGTFDDLVTRCESALPGLARQFRLPSGATMILAGISASRGPEAWSFSIDDSLPMGVTRAEAEASQYFAEPFKLTNLGALVVTPVPDGDMVIAANFEGIAADADDATTMWSLRKILAMQRHMKLPADIGGIGGHVAVTTINADGITQRVVERWTEDQIGDRLRPAPVDWDRWHRDNPKPNSNVSRLRRDMLASKANKAGNLRVIGGRTGARGAITS